MVGPTIYKDSPGPPEAKLKVFLFGPPRVEFQNYSVSIGRRQVRALLYRLATSSQPLPREILCYLFWPEIGEDIARRNLSRLITILHHVLPRNNSLITYDDQVGLNEQLIWSDVWAFKQLWDAWTTRGEIDVLLQAIDLVRGPFLAGFSMPSSSEFEIWAVTEREHWNRIALEGLKILIDAEARRQEYRRAIELAQRYLQLDELNEGIHRQLIEYYARIGDRNAAFRQYEQCSIVLERELGVDPLPETRDLYHAVQQQQVGYPFQLIKTPSMWVLPSLDAPLVGRETDLGVLTDALAAVHRNRFQAVLIAGEPGIGKSRLMQEFVRKVQDRALVFTGACYPEDRASPYQPIVRALRSQLALAPLPFITYPPWLADAARLLPELAAIHPALVEPLPSESGWAAARLYEAIEGLIAWLTGNLRPAILCVDDLHWVDSATLDLLAHLVHQQTIPSLLLIGTYRGEEGACLSRLTESLSRQNLLIELSLHGLGKSDVRRLLQRFGDKVDASEEIANNLQRITGGNPFFLLEILRAQMVSGSKLSDISSQDELPVPDSVRSALQARINHLSASARQVVEGAAVLGHAFDFDIVPLITGRSEVETVEGLEELVAHGLLAEKAGICYFRHEIVREVIYRNLSHYRLRLLHRRAAEAMEKLSPTEVAALAIHFERADRPGQAARYALGAGLLAKNVFAHVEARSWFDRTLELLEREASSLQEPKARAANCRARIEAISQRGWVLRLVGDMEAYDRDLAEEARLVELLHDPDALAHIRQRQASAHNWSCHYAAALEVAGEGVRLSQNVGDAWLEGMCWREVGLAARALGEYERAEFALFRALRLVDSPEQVTVTIHILGNLSTLYLHRGNPRQALETAQQALKLCEQSQLMFDRRVPLGDIGAAAAVLGDREMARRCLVESLEISRQATDRTQEILCLGHLGWLCIAQKHSDEALGHLRAALTLAEKIGSREELGWLHAGLAEACALAEDRTEACAHAQYAFALAKETGQAYGQELAEETMQKIR